MFRKISGKMQGFVTTSKIVMHLIDSFSQQATS